MVARTSECSFRREQDAWLSTKTHSSTVGIENLGSDQVLSILHCLPASTIIAFGMTCHRYHDIVNSDSLWAKICNREWGSRVVNSWARFKRRKVGWKQLYREMIVGGAVVWHQLDQIQQIPPSRASHSMNIVADNIIIFGGGCEGGRDLDDTWIANIPGIPLQGVEWQRVSTGTPSGRFGHSCAHIIDEYNNWLILFGGINDKGTRHCDTWVTMIDASLSCTWRMLQVDQSPPARGAHAGCFAGDGKLVIFGGINPDGIRLQDTWLLHFSSQQQLQQQQPVLWEEIFTGNSPPARSGHTLTWIGGKRIILFGGRGSKFEVLNDVWLLDLEDEYPVWTELLPHSAESASPEPGAVPSPRAGHSASLIFGGRVLIFGGEDAARCRKSDVWVLDPDAAFVSSATAASSPSSSTSVSKVGRKLWKKLKVKGKPPPNKTSFHQACPIQTGHGILVFGGMIDGSPPSGLIFTSHLYLLQIIPC